MCELRVGLRLRPIWPPFSSPALWKHFSLSNRGEQSPWNLKGWIYFLPAAPLEHKKEISGKKKMAPLAADSTLHHFLLYNVSPFILFPLLPLQRKKRKRKKEEKFKRKKAYSLVRAGYVPPRTKKISLFFFLFFSLSPQHKKEKDKYSLRSAPPAELKKMRRSSLCGTETSREQLLNWLRGKNGTRKIVDNFVVYAPISFEWKPIDCSWNYLR